MRIAYDGHIFRWQKTGGISRYFMEIISRLPADWDPTVLGLGEHNGSCPHHANLRISPLSAVKPRRLTQPVKRAWWRSTIIRNARVFHPTYYNLTGGLKYTDISCPVVVTVHDFIKMRYPKLEGDSTEANASQREAILRADHVICVSKATERDLLEFFPEVSNRTSVVYHGSSFPIADENPSEDIFIRPTFLFVGRRSTYKNFLMLLRAFARVCQTHKTVRLQIAGPPLNEEERWQMHFLGIADRVDVSVFPDETTLKRHYRNVVALLYPSWHEGFGIPPLEAMACGTLAITSNSSSLPEVVGDGGIMIDPGDEKEWTDCILQVANQKVERSEFIKRAKKRAATLTWTESAAQHIKIYAKLR